MVVCPEATESLAFAPDFLDFLAKKVLIEVCIGDDCRVGALFCVGAVPLSNLTQDGRLWQCAMGLSFEPVSGSIWRSNFWSCTDTTVEAAFWDCSSGPGLACATV